MCHALIIQDEATIAFQIADVVEQSGANSIAFAQTELESVSAAMEHKPDIIVSTVSLVTGAGTDAVTSIRHRLGWIPAIFITGNPEELDGYDHDGLLAKPFQANSLKEEVARFTSA